MARDPGDPDGQRGSLRVLAHVKCNVAPQAESLACEVQTVKLEDGTETARVEIIGKSEVAAADLLELPDHEARTERDDAIDFLRAELAEGPKPTNEIRNAAVKANIADRTLKRAKAQLGVTSKKDGLNGGWTWHLPEGGHEFEERQGGHAPQEGQDHISRLAPFPCARASADGLFASADGRRA